MDLGRGLFGKAPLLTPSDTEWINEMYQAAKEKRNIYQFSDAEEARIRNYFEAIDSEQDEERINALSDSALEQVTLLYRWMNSEGKNKTRKEAAKEAIMNNPMSPAGSTQAELEYHFAEDFGKAIPKKGAWIIVLHKIPVAARRKPVQYGIYYAMPHTERKTIPTAYMHGPGYNARTMKAKINTGTDVVMLMPIEYKILSSFKELVLPMVANGEYEMVRLGGGVGISSDKMDYLNSRGISKEKVLDLLIDNINTMDYAYYVPKEDVADTLDLMRAGARPEFVSKMLEHERNSKHYSI